MAFTEKNTWTSRYTAKSEAINVKYILADRFDDIFLADLKASFEKCVRTDSGNTITSPFDLFNMRIINLAKPTSPTDAANAQYVAEQIYKYEAMVTEPNVSGAVQLAIGKQYSMNQAGDVTFHLPIPSDTKVLNQILVDFKANGDSVNLGTTRMFERSISAFTNGAVYSIIFEYSNQLNEWVAGVMLKV